MHSQILEDGPGSCPICGMTLVKKLGQASQGAGISLNTVLQPVNSSVLSTLTAISPQEKEVSQDIVADGYLDYDSRAFKNITSRYAGRIERLYLKYAFHEVQAGQRIFDVYSADMVTAQQDLIFLSKSNTPDAALLNAAKQKLLLQDITEEQLNQVIKTGKPFYSLPVYSPYEGHIHDVAHSQMQGGTPAAETPSAYADNVPLSIKEGMYVEKGQVLFNVVNPHSLWAILKIQGAAVVRLKINQRVNITLPDVPGKIIIGKVNFIEPILRDGDKTTTVRVILDNMDHSLRVNSLIKATIPTGSIKGLWIPRKALIDLGLTRVVWLKNGAAFSAHQVFTGAINGNQIQITKGLTVADSIAANAQYLTDSDSFIKTKGNE